MVAGLLQPGGGHHYWSQTFWVRFLLGLLFLKAVCPILSELKHLSLYGLIGNTVFPDSMCMSNMSVSDSAPRGRRRTPWYWEMTHNLHWVSSAGYLNAPQLLPLLVNPNYCNWVAHCCWQCGRARSRSETCTFPHCSQIITLSDTRCTTKGSLYLKDSQNDLRKNGHQRTPG